MSFSITYTTTGREEITVDLIPTGTLKQRIRLLEPKKEILLIDKIEAGLSLLAHFLWAKETADPTFFDYQQAEEPTALEIFRLQLFGNIQRVLNNRDERLRLARLVYNASLSKVKDDNFIVSSPPEDAVDGGTIADGVPDQEIANLIQAIVVDQFENVLRLI